MIGSLITVDSAVASRRDMLTGLEASVQAINEAGGANGRPLELETCDDRLDPNQAGTCARQLADNEDIVAIVGGYSLYGQTYLPIFEEAGLAVIGHSANTLADLQSPNSFTFYAGSGTVGPAMAKRAVDAGATNILSLGFDLPIINDYVNPTIEEALEGTDATVEFIRVAPESVDPAPLVAQVQEKAPDAVLIVLADPLQVRTTTAIQQLGLDIDVIQPTSVATPETLATGDLDGVLGISWMPPVSDTSIPAVERYRADMAAVSGGDDWVESEVAAVGWEAAQLFVAAVEGLVTVDRQGVLDAMSGLTDYDSDGLFPSLDFSRPLTTFGGVTRLFNPYMVFTTVEGGTVSWDGEFVNVMESLIEG